MLYYGAFALGVAFSCILAGLMAATGDCRDEEVRA